MVVVQSITKLFNSSQLLQRRGVVMTTASTHHRASAVCGVCVCVCVTCMRCCVAAAVCRITSTSSSATATLLLFLSQARCAVGLLDLQAFDVRYGFIVSF